MDLLGAGRISGLIDGRRISGLIGAGRISGLIWAGGISRLIGRRANKWTYWGPGEYVDLLEPGE